MPGWLKVLLIVAIVIVFLIVGVVGAGVFWWIRNKDSVMDWAKEEVAQGRDFAKTSDNRGCVDEGVSRYKKEPGLGRAISTVIFMQTCLAESRETPGFCDNVPKTNEFRRSVEWQGEQCKKVDLAKDNYCRQIFQPVQQFCERRERDSSSNTNSGY